MKRQHVNYLVVGVVTIALFGLLGVVLVKIIGRSGPTDSYYIHYRSVAELAYGTAVFYEGFPVGQVDLVTPERTEEFTRFRVDISVKEGWEIPDNSEAIISAGLLAGVAIDIKEGDSKRMLSPGSEIPAVDSVGFMAALNDLGNDMQAITEGLREDVPSIMGDLRKLVERLKNGAAKLDDILDADNVSSVKTTLANLELFSERAKTMSKDLKHLSAEVRAMVEENRPGVDQSVDNLRLTLETLADRLDGVGYQMEAASRNLNEFTNSIRKNPGLLLSSQPQDETEELP